jgi:hypothetical protein
MHFINDSYQYESAGVFIYLYDGIGCINVWVMKRERYGHQKGILREVQGYIFKNYNYLFDKWPRKETT